MPPIDGPAAPPSAKAQKGIKRKAEIIKDHFKSFDAIVTLF
jgi:hypothetical protein